MVERGNPLSLGRHLSVCVVFTLNRPHVNPTTSPHYPQILDRNQPDRKRKYRTERGGFRTIRDPRLALTSGRGWKCLHDHVCSIQPPIRSSPLQNHGWGLMGTMKKAAGGQKRRWTPQQKRAYIIVAFKTCLVYVTMSSEAFYGLSAHSMVYLTSWFRKPAISKHSQQICKLIYLTQKRRSRKHWTTRGSPTTTKLSLELSPPHPPHPSCTRPPTSINLLFAAIPTSSLFGALSYWVGCRCIREYMKHIFSGVPGMFCFLPPTPTQNPKNTEGIAL